MDFKEVIKTQSREFAVATLWVVTELRKEVDANIDDTIEFEIKTNENIPSPEDQRRSLRFLGNAGVLITKNTKYSNNSGMNTMLSMQSSLGADSIKPRFYTFEVKRGELIKLYDLYITNKQKNAVRTSFDIQTGVLKISENILTFEMNSASYYVLKALFTEKGLYEIGEKLDFASANSTITENAETEALKDRSFYSGRDHINSQVFKKIGFSDFILLDNKHLELNPAVILLKSTEM